MRVKQVKLKTSLELKSKNTKIMIIDRLIRHIAHIVQEEDNRMKNITLKKTKNIYKYAHNGLLYKNLHTCEMIQTRKYVTHLFICIDL